MPAGGNDVDQSAPIYQASLLDSRQCHIHRRHPGLPLEAFVVTHQPLTVVFERSGTPNLGPGPLPGRSLHRQLFGGYVALAVEEGGVELPRLGVVPDHFDAAYSLFADRAVGGVQDEESPWSPLVDVAGRYRSCRRAIRSDNVARGHPSADQCIEWS